MATEVDICNLAISHLAHDATVTAIDPADGSMEASKCAVFYPIARDELLEAHAWRFALRRQSLTLFASNPSDIWAYAYALPNGCMRPLAVLLPEATDDLEPQAFTIEVLEDGVTPVLFTNVENAVLKFIVQQRDTTKFTPSFTVALSYQLAHYLAGAIPRDLRLKDSLLKIATAKTMVAAALDADSVSSNAYGPSMMPAHLKARQ